MPMRVRNMSKNSNSFYENTQETHWKHISGS